MMIFNILEYIRKNINLKSYSGYKFMFFQFDNFDRLIIVISMKQPVFSYDTYQTEGRKICFNTEFEIPLKYIDKFNKILIRTKDFREDYERIVREIDM